MSDTLLTYDVEIGSVFSILAYDVDFRQKIDIVLEKDMSTKLCSLKHFLHFVTNSGPPSSF